MKRRHGYRTIAYIAPLAIASAIGCGGTADSPEETSSTSQAVVGSDGIDHVARAVATGALNVALAYENNKVANNGDANYALYDNMIWSAQEYVVSGGKMVFDPNAPGYAFVPVQAMAQLEAMQDNADVATYLTSGLTSCFSAVKSAWIYSFRAGVLKGSLSDTTTTGTLPGLKPPPTMYTPTGYNAATVVDNFSTVGMQTGGSTVKVTLTSTVAHPDFWFGLLTYMNLTSFPNVAAVTAKFNAGGQTATCSPFNGPGGTANPYLTITLNGQAVAARFQGVGAQCYNTCTSTIVIDPTPYATPGPYYNSAGLVGPQPNPFAFDPTQGAATLDHYGQWGSTTSQTGAVVYGTFTGPVNHKGTITGYSWLQH